MPAPGAPPWAETVSDMLNKDHETRDTIQWLLNDICPQFVTGLLELGQQELEKQGQPALHPLPPYPPPPILLCGAPAGFSILGFTFL